DVEQERIGNGMVADSLRLSLAWDRATSAPTSLVAKVPAQEETSRQAAAATRTYLLEAAFYRELAGTLAVCRPTCYHARYDPETGDYVVLLEDLAPAQPGDQIAGCTADLAAAVIPELAALHGPRWGDPALIELDWLGRPDADSAMAFEQLVDFLYPGFVERYAGRVEPDVAALAERFVGVLDRYLAHRPAPWTVVHGDFRLDNLMFGGDRVAVLDWQTVRLGPAMSDVAYFIGSALQTDDRRATEEALVREYHTALLGAGGDMTWDDCWRGYRRHGFDGLLMGIIASMLVSRTDRGDDMFMAMVNRHGRQLLDLEAESLIDNPN
ncbi:MAG: phosphotransferase, partial [Ilumatobacteraceae bacterium]